MNDVFLKACRGEKVPYTPVWIMRQAGRYLDQYQEVRKKVDFLTLCKTPELAAKVTIQPVEILGVDAAILFSDILIPAEAMGQNLEFQENIGPILTPAIKNEDTIKKLSIPDPEDKMRFVMDTIRILRKELADRVPLIGFSGAPFTTATYMIEGGTSKNFLNTKRMIFESPELYKFLMDKITATITEYLKAQISAGAQAVQLFDTWAGVLAPKDYEEFALPYVKKVINAIKTRNSKLETRNIEVPIIYFVGETAGLLEEIRSSGADVFGIDWRINLDDAIKRLGNNPVVQGNLDPVALFLPRNKIEQRVKDILKRASSAQGHIFNLGHGVLPETPPENVIALVEMVHKFSRR
jgi:uroporphyrinogen decarboxylase